MSWIDSLQLENTGQASPAQRIVSLVPSISELLFDLDLEEEVLGITRYCIHPSHWQETKTIVGGTKKIVPDRIRKINPDLIIANKEENSRSDVVELAKSYPVWLTDIASLEDALEMIEKTGLLTGRTEKALAMSARIGNSFRQLKPLSPNLRTAYCIWKDPYMMAGGGTFINDMLRRCGMENIFGQEMRYPVATVEELRSRQCQLLILSSEPFPFGEEHKKELQAGLPATRIITADGTFFSWYGSRLLRAANYFAQLIDALRNAETAG